jgi:hypothetical protein
LPQGGVFTSALDGLTAFQLGPYNNSNVLYMSGSAPYRTTATLFLVGAPTSYDSLSILAASAGAWNGKSSFLINFTDGTSSHPILYYAPDWSYAIGLSNGAIIVGRANLSYGGIDTSSFALYQTDINLQALGLNRKPISSLTFSIATNAFYTGVFALSGMPAANRLPEMTSATWLTNATVQFSIANNGTSNLTVLATTNLALPMTEWLTLGPPTQISPGIFQFTDSQTSNYPARFYRVWSR